ncbi:MAG: DUF123 domain-containing protein [Anaerolineae bacterium]|nr:DUF123 domain-containing protein [Thermoflexales bacterium]MDW8408821.1 DUF123 domain-containing protein [Anaerolineae bacterium]
MTHTDSVLIVGDDNTGGAYVLRICVAANLRVRFGRYANGMPIAVSAGEYVYVGSARASLGAATLSTRLLRHLTRSEGRPPHILREEVWRACAQAGLSPLVFPRRKTLFWNIDYLLDEMEVEVVGVWVARSAWQNAESCLARAILLEAGVEPLAPRLGAHDSRDYAHVLRIPAQAGWWQMVCRRLMHVISSAQNSTFNN